MDTQARVQFKRQRILNNLRDAFKALGVCDPVLPSSSWSKRRFESGAFEARKCLRRLELLKSVSGHLVAANLEFGKHDLALDIPISWVDLTGTSSFPVLDLRDTVDYLIRSNNLPKLFGDQPVEGIQGTLLEFWRRYKVEWPDFEIYDAALQGKVSLSRCIPVYVHGDEGRGFKRSGVMILSVQGALGRGTRPFQLKHPLQRVRHIKMGLNLQGSSFNSRLLFTAMPKKYYSSENFRIVLSKLVDDLLCLQEGFQFQGEKWHIVCLGLKGDMPFLRSAGGFTRHWQRAVRKDSEARLAPGVCWMCLAGTEPGGPFEDFNLDARWSQIPTVVPWVETPVVLKLFHCPERPHDYFKPDVWHNYHGGAGKTFIASALAECLTLLEGSKDAKIAQMNDLLHVWAKGPGCKLPHSGPFCQERIQLTSWAVLPDANWSKFADTHTYHRFVEWFLGQRLVEVNKDEVLTMVLKAVQSINKAFSILYSSGLWMEAHEAREAGMMGRQWIQLYAQLADTCMRQRRLRFPIYVKFHMLDHHFRRLLHKASSAKWILNILAESVQADEESCF
eukprot:s920_g18.t1